MPQLRIYRMLYKQNRRPRQEVAVCVATSRTIGVWIQVLILTPKKTLVACFLRENLAKNSEVLCQI